MAVCAPLPIAIMVKTVATPIIRPIMVRAVCSRFFEMPAIATLKHELGDMLPLLLKSRGKAVDGTARPGGDLVPRQCGEQRRDTKNCNTSCGADSQRKHSVRKLRYNRTKGGGHATFIAPSFRLHADRAGPGFASGLRSRQ